MTATRAVRDAEPAYTISEETWRPIPGYEGWYEVSDQGRVWTHIRRRLMKPSIDSHGRPAVCLRRRAVRVHNLVARAFLGPCPAGQEVRHVDGDKTNNVLDNLAYGTHAENVRDQVEHGTHYMAQRTHCPQGHAYDAVNTYVSAKSLRHCRECSRQRVRARRALAKEMGA